MTKIQVFGIGCRKCSTLQENAEQALKNLGVQGQVEKVEDINEMVKYGILSTPALAVDGEVKISGKVASTEDIMTLLSS